MLIDRFMTVLVTAVLALSAPLTSTEVYAGPQEDELSEADKAFEALKEKYEAEQEKQDFERAPTIEAFGEIKSEQTVTFLIGLFAEESNPGIQAAIVRALGKQGTEKAVEGIILQGVPQLLKEYTFMVIGELALTEALSNPFDKDAEAWLIKNGLTPTVRGHVGAYKTVLMGIANLKSSRALPVIMNELLRKVNTPETQIALLQVFRDKKPRGADKAAYKFLASKNLEVQIAALEVLLVLEAKAYKSRYIALLKSKNWQIQVMAIDLLSICEDSRLAKRLIPFLGSPNEKVQIATVAALLNMGTLEVVEPLIAALDRTKGRVQDDIADSLARLTGVDLGPNAAQWDSWWGVNKRKVEIRKRTMKEFIKVKTKLQSDDKTLLYHGLRIASDKVAFIFDCSESMREVYERKEEGDPEDEDGNQGQTVVKKPTGKEGSDEGLMESKIEVAKKELIKVLKRLRDGVSINILRFNTIISPWRPALTKLGLRTRTDSIKFTQASNPAGMTNIYEALETAFQDDRVDTLFLLSDGAPTHGKYIKPMEILEEIGKINRLRKIKINTIGFNLKKHERELLEQLADQNFGVFIAR